MNWSGVWRGEWLKLSKNTTPKTNSRYASQPQLNKCVTRRRTCKVINQTQIETLVTFHIAEDQQQRPTSCHPGVFWSVARHRWICQMTVVGVLRQSWTSWHSPDKYDEAVPCSDLNIEMFSWKSIRRRVGSQCNSFRAGVMCSRRVECPGQKLWMSCTSPFFLAVFFAKGKPLEVN